MKTIAITTDGSGIVSLVKSVNEQEEKKLINEQAKRLAEREELAKKHEKQHEHYEKLECVLAKSSYDNLVDRGIIEEDNSFQESWLSFLKGGKSLDDFLENAPQDYKDILKKVREL